MSFLVGFDKKVTINFVGAVTLNVTEHTWSEWINFLDVTHSGSAGRQMGLASYLQGDGNIKANSDDAQVITNTASVNIIAGANGTCNFYHFATSSNPFVVGCMIVKVNLKTVIAGVCSYDFDVKLNALAGTYTRPT